MEKLTINQQKVFDLLKRFNDKRFERNVYLSLTTDEEYAGMVDYLSKNPEATKRDVQEKAFQLVRPRITERNLRLQAENKDYKEYY